MILRRMVAVTALAACSPGAAPSEPAAPEVPVTEPGPLPPSVRIRTLGAPAPTAVPTLGQAALPGTAWTLQTLEEERPLRFGEDGVTVRLGEVHGAFVAAPGGGTASLDGATWTFAALGPCALAAYDPGREAWWPARRVEPACPADEAVWDGLDLAVWRMPGGDLYSILPGGQAWRRGPGRSFDRPVGEVVLPSGATPLGLQFGKSRFDLVDLDPCHRVFVLREPRREHPAERDFPACAPGRATHRGWAWTWWSVAGDNLALLGDLSGEGGLTAGEFHYEGSGRDERGAWTRVRNELTLELEEGPTVLTAKDGCHGTLTRPDGTSFAAERFYPACGEGSGSPGSR